MFSSVVILSVTKTVCLGIIATCQVINSRRMARMGERDWVQENVTGHSLPSAS